MTTQAIFVGKGVMSFSEPRNVATSSGCASNDQKASFDNFMTGNSCDDNQVDNKNSAFGKDNGKTVVNSVNKYDSVSGKESAIQSKDINQLEVDIVDGKMCVTCLDNSMVESFNLDELLELIEEFFSEKLGVSKEELEKILAENGINAFGLFDMSNLQQVFAQINGIEDFSALLTDEGLSQAWNQLVDDIYNSNIQLSDNIVVNMSEIQKVFENNDVIADVNNKVIVNDENTDDISNFENITNDDVVTVDVRKQNNSQSQSMLFEDDTATEDLMSGTNVDNATTDTVSFNESLFESFMNNVQQSIEGIDKFDQAQIQQIKNVALQIIEGVKINVKANTSMLELQLNPESLGKVNVAIEVKEGIATASFLVKDELVKVAVESQIQTLKDAFEENGIKVDKVEVSVSDFSFEQSSQTFSQEKDGKSEKKSYSGDEINIIGTNAVQISDDESVVDEMDDSQINVTA